ncbi:MAG: hypothetical protein ACYC1C_19865 [Chloroflexota bacterium]
MPAIAAEVPAAALAGLAHNPHVDRVEPDVAVQAADAELAVAWYAKRFWVEESFRDDKSRLLLDEVRVESTLRLDRLLMALTIAVCWLCLIADSKVGVLPTNWNAAVVTWGQASLILRPLST